MLEGDAGHKRSEVLRSAFRDPFSAVATIAGAYLMSRSSSKATKSQQQSTDKALDYEKERDRKADEQREKDRALAKAAWDAEERRRLPRRAAIASLLRARGINVPEPTARPYDPEAVGTESATSMPESSMGGTSISDMYSAPLSGMGQPSSPSLEAPGPEGTIDEMFRRRQAPGGY